MDVMSCVDKFACFPQLWELIDWLINHESKETSHHQLHVVPSDHSLKKQVVIQPNCRHTEHPTQNMLMGVLDVKTHQTKPQNTWEKANFVPSCHGAFVAKCWTRTTQWPWSNFWICANKGMVKPSAIQQSAVQSRHSITPSRGLTSEQREVKLLKQSMKGNACSTIPWKVQWWPSIILLHGWGEILCFNVVHIWLITLKQTRYSDSFSNQKLKYHADCND